MKLKEYEKFVTSRSMEIIKVIVGKDIGSDYDVYISDGFTRFPDEEHNGPHYKTMYAFGQDEEILVGEFFTTPFLKGETKEHRLGDCEKRVHEQLLIFKGTGCLK